MSSNNHNKLSTLILAFFWIMLTIFASLVLCIMFGPIGTILTFIILIVALTVTINIES